MFKRIPRLQTGNNVTFSKSSLSGIYPSSCCSVMPISTGSGGCNRVGDNTSNKKRTKMVPTLNINTSIKFFDRIQERHNSCKNVSYWYSPSNFRYCLNLFSLNVVFFFFLSKLPFFPVSLPCHQQAKQRTFLHIVAIFNYIVSNE